MALLIHQQLLLTLLCGSQTASAFVSPHHHSRRLLAAAGYSDQHQHQRWLLSSSNNNLDLGHNNNNMIKVSPTITPTRLHLFGNIFGGNEVEEDQKDLQENELARFSHLISNQDNPTVKFDSLSIMVLEWSKLFTDEKQKMGLTTPVVLVEFPAQESAGDGGEVTNYSGIQLLFKKKGKTKGRSAYQDKDDEKLKEKGDNDKDTIKQGGVEVKVEQLNGGDLQVIASRCEIEEGTIVKEMSEQTIIDSLRKAMAAWKKEQPFS